MPYEPNDTLTIQSALADVGKARQRVHLLRSILGAIVDPAGKAWVSDWLRECEGAAYQAQRALEVILKRSRQ
jgi:hypothetical protein